MSDSEVPVPSLDSAKIAERAEAVRQLGVVGGPDSLFRLLDFATGDKSSGVRLTAATATADLLERYRLPEHHDQVPESMRREVLARLRSLDPGANTSLFQVIGELGLPEVTRSLVLGLRDPRVDVRTGALVGLERLCRSASVNGDPSILEECQRFLGDSRIRPEMQVEIARLCARLGFAALLPVLEEIHGRLVRKLATSMATAIHDLREVSSQEELMCAWQSVESHGEERPRKAAVEWLVLCEGGCLRGVEGSLVWSDSEFVGAPPTHARLGGDLVPVRRLKLRLVGSEIVEQLQVGLRSWRRPADKELVRLLHALALGSLPVHLRPKVRDSLHRGLSARVLGAYARGVLAWWCGELAEAQEILGGLTPSRVPPELHWFLANAHLAAGRDSDASAELVRYIERAGKKGVFIADARKLLGEP